MPLYQVYIRDAVDKVNFKVHSKFLGYETLFDYSIPKSTMLYRIKIMEDALSGNKDKLVDDYMREDVYTDRSIQCTEEYNLINTFISDIEIYQGDHYSLNEKNYKISQRVIVCTELGEIIYLYLEKYLNVIQNLDEIKEADELVSKYNRLRNEYKLYYLKSRKKFLGIF